MASKKYEKVSVAPGDHVYKSVWMPVIWKELQVKLEEGNEHEEHTIAVFLEVYAMPSLHDPGIYYCEHVLTPDIY